MVAVVATMRGQVESHREAFLAGRQVAPVKSITLFCGAETGVLPDRPGLGEVHAGIRAAKEGRGTGDEFGERITDCGLRITDLSLIHI